VTIPDDWQHGGSRLSWRSSTTANRGKQVEVFHAHRTCIRYTTMRAC
jgi:hypothetical protein